MTTTYVNWGKSRIILTWISSYILPQPELITSVHAFLSMYKKVSTIKTQNYVQTL